MVDKPGRELNSATDRWLRTEVSQAFRCTCAVPSLDRQMNAALKDEMGLIDAVEDQPRHVVISHAGNSGGIHEAVIDTAVKDGAGI